jgi:hypothetical protein
MQVQTLLVGTPEPQQVDLPIARTLQAETEVRDAIEAGVKVGPVFALFFSRVLRGTFTCHAYDGDRTGWSFRGRIVQGGREIDFAEDVALGLLEWAGLDAVREFWRRRAVAAEHARRAAALLAEAAQAVDACRRARAESLDLQDVDSQGAGAGRVVCRELGHLHRVTGDVAKSMTGFAED